MWAFCGTIFLFAASGVASQITTTSKIQLLKAVVSTACDTPNQSTVEADKCCRFPDLFADSMVDQCEKDFSLNNSMINNEMLADSVSCFIKKFKKYFNRKLFPVRC